MSMKETTQQILNNLNITIPDAILSLPSKDEIQEAARNGKYVWRKYTLKDAIITGQMTKGQPITVKYTASDNSPIPLYTIINSTVTVYENSVWKYRLTFLENHIAKQERNGSNTTTCTYSYNENTGIAVTNDTVFRFDAYTDVRVENIPQKSCSKIDFVVSDSEIAFPNEGMLDGFWYKKLSGNSDIDFGEITLIDNQNSISIETSLSTMPSNMALIRNPIALTSSYGFFIINGTVYHLYKNTSGVQFDNKLTAPTFNDGVITYTPGALLARGTYRWYALEQYDITIDPDPEPPEPPKTKYKFTVVSDSFIPTATYEFEDGMTFSQWISSSYNTAGYFVGDSNEIWYDAYALYDTFGNIVRTTDKCKNNYEYELM